MHKLKKIDFCRHLSFAVVGGFFAAYAILCRSGVMGNAQTVNLLELLIDALFCEVNPIPVKRALELEGFPVGAPRLPLTPLSDANLPRLAAALGRA